MFYFSMLADIPDKNDENCSLIFSVYFKGLTMELVSSVFEDVYDKSIVNSR